MTKKNHPLNLNSKMCSVGIDESASPHYQTWSDERLIDGYRRNSVLLREYNTDLRTLQTLCSIEEQLRARNIDPEKIIKDLIE
ncbi:hypothetical protein [Halocatena marina]|uniref:Uncharacterized protein n=1 Tax=Halocatena marina TaxID=2934937 RepID=A0ABD5YLF8_9EURY|nr:hypothetical protein [Halocatena marina]